MPPAEGPGPGYVERYVDLDGVRLHCVEAGDGPLVVLLHGFPEFWYSWRYQIPALATAGFHVVAPDMRGYNLSDKPAGVSSYRWELLTRDVAGLIRARGAGRAVVVGHDWGGAVAWLFAMRYPELVERLVIMNAPHPAVFRRALRTRRQLWKSRYMLFFQLPWLPEWGIRARDFALLRRLLRREPARPDAFSPADIDRYVAAAGRPGALTGSINYYRALLRHGGRGLWRALRRIDRPVLVIWGQRDPYLEAELAEPGPAWAPQARVERLPQASHWVQLDQPEEVNRLLLDFLAGRSAVFVPASP